MGQKFSWDKLLKKQDKKDNTIQLNQSQVVEEKPAKSEKKKKNKEQNDIGPMAPLNAPLDSPQQSASTEQPVVQTPQKQDDAPKAPLVIDWDTYKSMTEGEQSQPQPEMSASELQTPVEANQAEVTEPVGLIQPVQTHQNPEEPVQQEKNVPTQPTETVAQNPPVDSLPPAVNPPTTSIDQMQPISLENTKSSEYHESPKLERDTPSPVKPDIPLSDTNGWDDVELTPAEMQKLSIHPPADVQNPTDNNEVEDKFFESPKFSEPQAPESLETQSVNNLEPIDLGNSYQATEDASSDWSEPIQSGSNQIELQPPTFEMPAEETHSTVQDGFEPAMEVENVQEPAWNPEPPVSEPITDEQAIEEPVFENPLVDETNTNEPIVEEKQALPEESKGLFSKFKMSFSGSKNEEPQEVLKEKAESQKSESWDVADQPTAEAPEPIQEEVVSEQPVTQEPATSNDIPDIFKKAMGNYEPRVESPQANERHSPFGDIPDFNETTVEQTSSPELVSSQEVASTPETEIVAEPVNEASLQETSLSQESIRATSEQEDTVSGDFESGVPAEYKIADDPELQKGKDKKLGDLLLDNGLITQAQLMRALGRQKETKEKLGQILISIQAISEKRLMQVLAAQKGVSAWHLEEDQPSEDALKLLPEEMCRVFQILPLAVRGDLLILAMKDVKDLEAIEVARQQTKMRIEPVMADDARLAFTIDQVYGVSESRRLAMEDELVSQALGQLNLAEDQSPVAMGQSESITHLLDSILSHAIQNQATDIHFEPKFNRTEVRLRINGELKNVREIPEELAPAIISRLKSLADLNPQESRMPEFGTLTTKFGERDVELRLNITPCTRGQAASAKVLDRTTGLKSLSQLGLSEENYDLLEQAMNKPYGLVLVSGPANSGKTTTMYALLQSLESQNKKIMTVEEPVEYDLSFADQAEVNRKIGLTVSSQLNAVMKQDCDVIMIGELADKETVAMALRAAITGRLVIAGIHAIDSISAINQMVEMGADPKLLAAALVCVTNQRVVRHLNDETKEQATVTDEQKVFIEKAFGSSDIDQVWEAGSGEQPWKGRTGIYEVLTVTNEIKCMIADGSSQDEIAEVASYYKYLPIQQEAFAKVLSGETTLEEATALLEFETIARDDNPRTLDFSQAG